MPNANTIKNRVAGTLRNQVLSQTLTSTVETFFLMGTDTGSTTALVGPPNGTNIVGSEVTLDSIDTTNTSFLVGGGREYGPTRGSNRPYFTSSSFNGRPFKIRLTGTGTAATAGGNTLALNLYAVTSSLPVTLATPVNAAYATATSGGTLTDLTAYYYRVVATNATGTSLASPEASETTGNSGSNINTVTVNWVAVTGATGYKVYGRSTGAEQLLATVGNVTTYVDTGAASPSGGLPATLIGGTGASNTVAMATAHPFNFTVEATLMWDNLTQSITGIQWYNINYNSTQPTHAFSAPAALPAIPTGIATNAALQFIASATWGNAAGGTIQVNEFGVDFA